MAYIQWFNTVCLEPRDGKNARNGMKMRTVEFTIESPRLDASGQPTVDSNGRAVMNTILMTQPLAAVVDHPLFGPDSLEVEFEMEISTSAMDTTSSAREATVEAEASANFFFASARTKTTAKVSSKSESVRKTDTSARYHVRATGKSKPMPEGMNKTLDLLREIAMKPVVLPKAS
jgi:hypothetical protein